MLVASSSVTVVIAANVSKVAQKTGIVEFVGPLLNFGINLIPYLLIWLLFMGLYLVMPNKKVNFLSALFAGIVAGSMYQIVELVYIGFQVGVSKYNAIYGSFAALPLFLIWVQTSWNIVLFGAELSYAFQNIDSLILEQKKTQPTAYQKLKHSMSVLKALLHHYSDKKPLITAEQIAREANIPIHKTLNMLTDLEECNLVVSHEENDETLFQPARSSEQLDVSFVIESLIGDEKDNGEEHPELEVVIAQLKEDIRKNTGKLKIADL